MIKKALVFAVAAACLASATAFAQTYERGEHDDGERSTRYERHDNNDRYDRYDRYDRRDRRDRNERRDYRRRDGYSNHGYDARSNGYNYNDGYRDHGQQRYRMQRGERLSQYYRGDHYVVSDWRSRRLQAPQYGYHWVQAGNDYALVAIATGIIASVLLNH